ncbi:37358_t:CDS:2 [Gigaspora margarita]|uniref:37358_t:CDS:1 n=1 Tax=Gigaspora margarita TaxID=4874 RepID=A0ABN7V7W3_GIGMA|nr:37358_t:CDS:2 [Gigaspora margarita]
MAEAFELYYDPEISVEDGDKSSSSEEKNLKQEERELGFEIVLENFVNATLNHINGIGIKWDEEPDTTNNLEHACKVWKKKKSVCAVQPDKCEITDEEVNLNAETPGKDNDQPI